MFKPEGLKLPDCPCFQKKPERMNAYIDHVIGIMIIQMRSDMAALNICKKADDYFIAGMIWACIAVVIDARENKDKGKLSFEDYKKEYEEAYDRLRPLVLERLIYADGVMQRN